MDADRTDLSVLLTNVLSLLWQVSIVPRTNATLGFAQYTTTDKKLYSDVEVTFYQSLYIIELCKKGVPHFVA